MLRVQPRASGWPVRELMAICGSLMDGECVAAYFACGAEDKFRRFVRGWPDYFYYDPDRDAVAVARHSTSTAVDQWLVRYLALRAEASDGWLDIGTERAKIWHSVLPDVMGRHFRVVYEGKLELFLRLHPADFTVYDGGDFARLSSSCYLTNVTPRAREEGLVFFFIDLLLKIGATENAPCRVHAVAKYLSFMERKDRRLLNKSYGASLNVFFVLNPGNFVTTKGNKGCVFLRNRYPHYGAAVFLKQQVQILRSTRSSGHSPKVSVEELASRAKYSSFAQYFLSVNSVESEVRSIARQHPAIFQVSGQGDELWLRKVCRPWPKNHWDAETELLAVTYFVDVLKHVDATSPSRAICFNYIVRAVSAAPPSCRPYLATAYPELEIICFFHLHPRVFDLSSVNRVFLKNTEETPPTGTAPVVPGRKPDGDSAEKQAVRYVAKLLKYVRDLDSDLLASCMESVCDEIRYYCLASVKHRLRDVIESGRAALCARGTGADSTPSPVTCGPEKKKGASRREKATQAEVQNKGYRTRVFRRKKTKQHAAAAPLAKANGTHQVSGALSDNAVSTAAVRAAVYENTKQ